MPWFAAGPPSRERSSIGCAHDGGFGYSRFGKSRSSALSSSLELASLSRSGRPGSWNVSYAKPSTVSRYFEQDFSSHVVPPSGRSSYLHASPFSIIVASIGLPSTYTTLQRTSTD